MTEETKKVQPKKFRLDGHLDRRYDNEQLFKPGTSGNPAGRAVGSRNKFGEKFVTQFMEHWNIHGEKALDELAENNVEAYSRLAIAILPKIVELGDETKEAITEAIKKRLPFESIREKIEKDESVVH